VGQFRDLGAAELLGELGALSGDHLEQISDAGIAALARAGTVAVMLPGACVQLRLPVPPIARLRAAGIPMAIATDLNPGSSYCESLGIQLWLAATHFGMTVEEAWLGVTRNAARALGMPGGTLALGAAGDLILWRCSDPAAVPYHYGGSPPIDDVFVAGAQVTMQKLA
jgi:imidazolonepropionase